MRIAVCISGQIRTGVIVSKNIKHFLGSLYSNCDFFIHTWDTNTTISYCGSNIYPDNEKVTQDTIDKIKNIYNPKKIQVDDLYEITKNKIKTNNNIKILWYSFYKSVEYKRRYEIENDFIYDLVLKLRFDIVFPEYRSLLIDFSLIKKSLHNTIYIENSPEIIEKDCLFVDDVYYLSNSHNINILSEYYYDIIKQRFDDVNGYKLYKKLKHNNINIFNDYKSIGYKYELTYSIYRKEFIKFFSIYDFKKIRIANLYMFEEYSTKKTKINNSSIEIHGHYIDELKKEYDIDDILEFGFCDSYYKLSELKKKIINENCSMH